MFTFWSGILRVAAVRSDVCMFRAVWWLVGRQGGSSIGLECWGPTEGDGFTMAQGPEIGKLERYMA